MSWVVIAAQSASDCFKTAFEACKIALEFMVPVVLLSDGYIANGSEPWKLPDLDKFLKSILKLSKNQKMKNFYLTREMKKPYQENGRYCLGHLV